MTTTSYTAAAGTTPATRTDTGPDGRVQLTTYDALGRKARVTDNVHDQAFTGSADDPAAGGVHLQPGRDQAHRDRPAGPHDRHHPRRARPPGQPGRRHGHHPRHAPTTTLPTPRRRRSRPPAPSTAAQTRTTTYDNGNRPVTVQRQYSDGTADPTQTTSYDGLGRLTSQTVDDLTLGVTYLGAGGASTAKSATPQDPAEFPGEPLSISTTHALGGQQTEQRPRSSPAPAREGTHADLRPGGPDAHLDRPQRPHHQLHLQRRRHGRDAHHAVRHRRHQHLRPDHRTAVDRDGAAQERADHHRDLRLRPGRAARCRAGPDDHRRREHRDARLRRRPARRVPRRTPTAPPPRRRTWTTGTLATTADVTGAVTSYAPDGLGRVKTATQTRGATTLASVTYTYDAMSRVATTTRANGVTTTNGWTSRNQLSSQRTTTASGTVVEEHLYTYDDHGNVSVRIDTAAGRHVDHALRLRRLRPADRLGGLPRRPRVREARDVHDVHARARPATSSARPLGRRARRPRPPRRTRSTRPASSPPRPRTAPPCSRPSTVTDGS